MVIRQGDYLTVADMVRELKTPTETVKARLKRLNIKPLSRDALYPISVLEMLRKTPGKGRPKKLETTGKGKSAGKLAKGKKT